MIDKIPFIKMHGLGNDFVIIDKRFNDIEIDNSMYKALANRHLGVGCDQVVIIDKSTKADCFVRFFNADGSQSNACGNATRCVAFLMAVENDEKKDILLETNNGLIPCIYEGNNIVSVNMGKPKFKWNEIPISISCDTSNLPIEYDEFSEPFALSIGNPHAVFFVNNVNTVDAQKYGSYFEKHEIFPERANIEFVEILSPADIKVKVWERGSGETLACGTGACAAAVASIIKRGLDREIYVFLKGGELKIKVDEDYNITMRGEVSLVFRGEVFVDQLLQYE